MVTPTTTREYTRSRIAIKSLESAHMNTSTSNVESESPSISIKTYGSASKSFVALHNLVKTDDEAIQNTSVPPLSKPHLSTPFSKQNMSNSFTLIS